MFFDVGLFLGDVGGSKGFWGLFGGPGVGVSGPRKRLPEEGVF